MEGETPPPFFLLQTFDESVVDYKQLRFNVVHQKACCAGQVFVSLLLRDYFFGAGGDGGGVGRGLLGVGVVAGGF